MRRITVIKRNIKCAVCATLVAALAFSAGCGGRAGSRIRFGAANLRLMSACRRRSG